MLTGLKEFYGRLLPVPFLGPFLRLFVLGLKSARNWLLNRNPVLDAQVVFLIDQVARQKRELDVLRMRIEALEGRRLVSQGRSSADDYEAIR